MTASLQLAVGNTYRQLPMSQARLDRNGIYHKIHDWTLFVDVVQGDADVIERVLFDLGASFEPSVFTCASPIPIQLERNNDGTTTTTTTTKAWRFCTRQQSYAPVEAQIKIRGTGGSVLQAAYTIRFDQQHEQQSTLITFRETRTIKPLRMLKFPESQRFGVELELISAQSVQPNEVASSLTRAGIPVTVIQNYSAGRSTSLEWKIVPDSSIMRSPSLPDRDKFQLVSPILQGGAGLGQLSRILNTLGTKINPRFKVNKSMGFHVHVDVSLLSLDQLIKVCQNYIKYEAVMDSLMPPSRRTGSPESQKYFQSNRMSVARAIVDGRNKQCHDALAACQDIESLVHVMNNSVATVNSGRYYKLNLQNLVTGRQPTIEFRQHSATLNFEKVSAWVRFCVALVNHSAKLAAPSPMAHKNRNLLEYQFDCLFYYVIKDRALRNYYRERREHLDDDEDACCTGCAIGGACTNNSNSRKRAKLV